MITSNAGKLSPSTSSPVPGEAPGGAAPAPPLSGHVLKPLMTPGERRAFAALAGAWFVALAVFWAWWLKPEHNVDHLRFVVNSILIFWATVIPGYFVMIFSRSRIPDAAQPLPTHWRVAMVVTKAPSEPFDVVRATLEAMLVQTYPHDTWIADEDPSPETLDWCERNGVLVSTRKNVEAYHQKTWPRRTRCKEGNLAYFYDHYGYANYDFVAQLDADHVPSPTYLTEMLRPFQDPTVGYVSAPSICDSNAAESWSARGRLYVEGALHGALQAGYNGGLAPLCIGSHYAVRTQALREIGGIGPELAEDHSTTLIMNARGWKGVHALDAIAHGEGPPTFAALATQEFQWSRSLAILLFRYTRNYFGGLTPALKAQFLFAQLWYPLFSVFMACSVLIPILALATGRTWAAVAYPDFFVHSALVTVSIIGLMYWVKSRGWFRPSDAKVISWEGAVFTFARWPWSLLGLVVGAYDVVTGREFTFRVTPKGVAETAPAPLSVVLPYLGLSLASAAAAALVREAGAARGFYVFALLNALIYLGIAILVVVMHGRENGGTRNPLRSLVGARGPMIAAAAAVLVLAGQQRLSLGLEGIFTPGDLTVEAVQEKVADLTRAAEWSGSGGPAAGGSVKRVLAYGAYDPSGRFDHSKDLAVQHVFVSWADEGARGAVAKAAGAARAQDRWLMVTVEPFARSGQTSASLLRDTAAGLYDANIDAVCGAIGQSGVNVFVRWGHEMDLKTRRYPWQMAEPVAFVQAYRHFVDRCRTRAPSRTFYVWSPAGDPGLGRFYPGGGWVDWVGLSLYDCPACRTDGGTGLRSFRTIATEKYARVARWGKPVMIAEMGVAGSAATQAQWLSRASADACRFPLLRMLVYFNAKEHVGVWGSGPPPDWETDRKALEGAVEATPQVCGPGSRGTVR